MKDDKTGLLTVSIVSHGHATWLERLVPQVLNCTAVGQVLVTLNLPEKLSLPEDVRLKVIQNTIPKGFGANHNQAFAYAQHDAFVVLNPDVFLPDNNVFALLLNESIMHGAGIVSPMALSVHGEREDNWRQFPTWSLLVGKLFGGDGGRYSFSDNSLDAFSIDWASGLCLLIRRKVYETLRGFDERFFMYYEDVDLCVRAWRAGFRVLACPEAKLVHEGQRASHRHLKHGRWHVISLLRYFSIRYGLQPYW